MIETGCCQGETMSKPVYASTGYEGLQKVYLITGRYERGVGKGRALDLALPASIQEWIPRPTYGAPIHYKCALKGTVKYASPIHTVGGGTGSPSFLAHGSNSNLYLQEYYESGSYILSQRKYRIVATGPSP